jgi:quinol monooxygenase YgiN
MIVFMATVQARADTADQVAEPLRQLAVVTRAEPGCLAYMVHRGIDDPTLFVTVEECRSQEDIERHFEMPYVRDLIAHAPALLAAEPEFRSFERL